MIDIELVRNPRKHHPGPSSFTKRLINLLIEGAKNPYANVFYRKEDGQEIYSISYSDWGNLVIDVEISIKGKNKYKISGRFSTSHELSVNLTSPKWFKENEKHIKKLQKRLDDLISWKVQQSTEFILKTAAMLPHSMPEDADDDDFDYDN